jgi:hypothetical protein
LTALRRSWPAIRMSGEIDAGNRGRCLRGRLPDLSCRRRHPDPGSGAGRETSAVNGLAPEVLRGQDGHPAKWTM